MIIFFYFIFLSLNFYFIKQYVARPIDADYVLTPMFISNIIKFILFSASSVKFHAGYAYDYAIS